MRGSFLILILTIFHNAPALSQKVKSQFILGENFSDNNLNWNENNYSEDQPYDALIMDQRYRLNLPFDTFWGFTWVNLPDALNKMSDYPNAELTFDLEIIEGKANGYFAIGLVFDLHKVTKQCPGGDFYNLEISGNISSSTIKSVIRQRKNCSYRNIGNPIVESSANARLEAGEYNKITLRKNSEQYEVYINKVLVSTFDYEGTLKFSKLYYETGKYAIDNIALNSISYEVEQPLIPQGSQSASNRPQIYILLAGIKTYDHPSYKQSALKYTVNDIDAMYEFYTSVNGGAVKPENIVYLKEANATRDNITKKLAGLFSKARESDAVITFFRAWRSGIVLRL